MQLFIFLKNHFLTSKGHPKGQILAIMVHYNVFVHRIKNKINLNVMTQIVSSEIVKRVAIVKEMELYMKLHAKNVMTNT